MNEEIRKWAEEGPKPQKKAPGKAFRAGMSLKDLFDKFPDEAAAEAWFAEQRWPDGPECPHCGGTNVQAGAKHPAMPYRCRGCRKFFSVRFGTVMQSSKLGYREWAIAICLFNTNIKGTSSMKLHRDLGISQKAAWHMAHRIRECYRTSAEPFAGPVEADESHFGGKAKNMHARVQAQRITGRGAADKTTVAGVKDRATNKVAARVVESTDAPTLQGFVTEHSAEGADVFTYDHPSYKGLTNHQTVAHSVSEYVNGQAHINGMESFWAMLKRGYHGTFHHVSAKHLQRYVDEFAGRHNTRPKDTIDQMAHTARAMEGCRLPFDALTAP